jgi:hypothetical protein
MQIGGKTDAARQTSAKANIDSQQLRNEVLKKVRDEWEGSKDKGLI